MAKSEGIRIFLRIRPPMTAAQGRLLGAETTSSSNNNSEDTVLYEVEHTFESSHLKLHLSRKENNEVINNSNENHTYTFRRVFEPRSTQEEVFNTVAVDCVQSFLDGVNATIFAYGQTGSGKTYSITGGTDSYDDRGIIPRSLKMIYDHINRKRNEFNYTVSISYLQIYNMKGQDLLNHGKDARSLEELPNVTIHDTGSSTIMTFDGNNNNNNNSNGEVVLKGLESHFAPTLADALNLLFLGDTNRLYCETPMNKTSSRSHCIFTISLESRPVNSTSVRYSKLNLVDLAGSERVARSQISGNLLNEAKHINLSLHYLEHVILSLGQAAAAAGANTHGNNNNNNSMSVDSHSSIYSNANNSNAAMVHIPFRNSFMTMVLKDSLGRNCKTVMLATAHFSFAMLPETISTCAFAQRVALIKQSPSVNVATDPALLIKQLKAEVASLKDRLSYYESSNNNDNKSVSSERTLDSDERNMCKRLVEEYIQEPNTNVRFSGFQGDFARIYYCFQILKEMLMMAKQNNKSSSLYAANTSSTSSMLKSRDQDSNIKSGNQGREFNSMYNSNKTEMNKNVNSNGLVETTDLRQTVEALQHNLQHKESEMNILLELLHKTQNSMTAAQVQTNENDMEGIVHRESVLAQIAQLRESARKSISGIANSQTVSQTINRELQQEQQQTQEEKLNETNKENSNTTISNANNPTPEVLLEHVQHMSYSGQINAEQARAASEYLQSKLNSLSDKYHLDQLTFSNETLVRDRAAAFEAFKASYKNYDKVETAKSLLKEKYLTCKQTAKELNATVDEIKQIKREIQRLRAERAINGTIGDDANNSNNNHQQEEKKKEEEEQEEQEGKNEAAMLEALSIAKNKYNDYAGALKAQKEDIESMHAYMKRSQEQLTHDYEEWLNLRNQQLLLLNATATTNATKHVEKNSISISNDNNANKTCGEVASVVTCENKTSNNSNIINNNSNVNAKEFASSPSLSESKDKPHDIHIIHSASLTSHNIHSANPHNEHNNKSSIDAKDNEDASGKHYAHSEPSSSHIMPSSSVFVYNESSPSTSICNNNNSNTNGLQLSEMASPQTNNWVKPSLLPIPAHALPRITSVRATMERVLPSVGSENASASSSSLFSVNNKAHTNPTRLEPLPFTALIQGGGNNTNITMTSKMAPASPREISPLPQENNYNNNNVNTKINLPHSPFISSVSTSASTSSSSANTNFLSNSSATSFRQTSESPTHKM